MSEAVKPVSPDEMLTLAKQSLAKANNVEITDAKVAKAAETLGPILKETLTGNAEKVGISQDTVNELLTNVHSSLSNGTHPDTIKTEAKFGALTAIAEKQVEQIMPEALKAATNVDVAFGGKPKAYEQALGEAMATESSKQAVKAMPEAIDLLATTTGKLQADAAEGERLIKSVGQAEIDSMVTKSNDFVNGAELKSAVDLRSAHVKLAAEAAEATKGGTKLSEEAEKALKTANEAAATAEKSANSIFGKLRGANPTVDGKKAFDRSIQTAIDNSRESNPELHAQLKTIMESNVKTELGELGAALSKDRFAAAGIETTVGKELGAVAKASSEGMSKWGKYGMIAGGAAIAGLAVKSALADKPADPQTGEKPKMSFMGKVTTALAAVVGAGMIVAAVRGGNPMTGLKEGEGFVDKLRKAAQSTSRTGAYAGR